MYVLAPNDGLFCGTFYKMKLLGILCKRFLTDAGRYSTSYHIEMKENLGKTNALGEDRTHDLQIALISDYETDALPTALRRHILTVNACNIQ